MQHATTTDTHWQISFSLLHRRRTKTLLQSPRAVITPFLRNLDCRSTTTIVTVLKFDLKKIIERKKAEIINKDEFNNWKINVPNN